MPKRNRGFREMAAAARRMEAAQRKFRAAKDRSRKEAIAFVKDMNALVGN